MSYRIKWQAKETFWHEAICAKQQQEDGEDDDEDVDDDEKMRQAFERGREREGEIMAKAKPTHTDQHTHHAGVPFPCRNSYSFLRNLFDALVMYVHTLAQIIITH